LLRSQLKLASDDVREISKERFESTLLVNWRFCPNHH
jgi:hypothetical protein